MATKKKRTKQSPEEGKRSAVESATASSIGGSGGARPPKITSIQVTDLLKPLLGEKAALLTLKLSGDISDEKMSGIRNFAHEAGANARIELTVHLADKTADFTKSVNDFLDRLHDETAQFTVCARCGDPGWLPPKKPGKPGRPKGPGKEKPPGKSKDA